MMSFWIFLLIPMVLTSEIELKITNYTIKIKENTLQSVYATGESSNELNLSNLGLQAVQKSAFDNLSNLKVLILANNSLNRLPEFVFLNLTNLEHLCLADNKFTEFENVFVGLNNLKSLNISNNPIKFLGKNYLYGLSKFSEVLTKGNSLLGISSALFENPFLRDQLQKTNENKIKTTPEEDKDESKTIVEKLRIQICKNEDNIRLVNILNEEELLSSDCQEATIDRQGKKLSLENLGISKFSKNWYRLQTSFLTTINLAGNEITELSADLLNDLPKNIKIVNLSENKIMRLEKGIINNSYISTLDLSKNLIQEIEENALENMKLDELYLKDNKLNDLQFVTSLPSNIKNLDLEGNEIKNLSAGLLSGLNHLRKLNLYNNKIKEVTKQSLTGLFDLEDLDLSSNCIQKIETGSFQDLKFLRILNLHNNSIAGLEKRTFDGLKSLEALNMGMNKFTKITKAIRLSLPTSLERLRLDYNEIESLEAGSFVNVPKETLSLNGNKISKIEKGSFYLPNLMTLRLDNNFLSDLDGDEFVGLRNLKYLVLEANGIAKVSKGFAKNLGNLESLNLSNNPINKLENGALFGLPKLTDSNVYLVDVPVEVVQGGLFDNV